VRYLEVDDVHVACCTIGDGDRDIVIMNPGTIPVDSVLAEPRLAHGIDRLASFARVTWFNQRGIGLSDRCTADRLPSVDDWVRDLTAVLDAIGATAPFLYACEDTTAIALRFAAERPDRVAGIVLTNAYARFTRTDDYPYGFDPVLAEQSASEVTAAQPSGDRFDLLSVIAPSVAADDDFRSWWDEAGRRGATPQVARALRSRHQNDDLRAVIDRVTVPVLHLVNPASLAHHPGHDRYLEAHLAHVETIEMPGPDELWWLDTSGTFLAEVERFTCS
jgi:pimeloyl-ACP methyl ester carboxylesterase